MSLSYSNHIIANLSHATSWLSSLHSKYKLNLGQWKHFKVNVWCILLWNQQLLFTGAWTANFSHTTRRLKMKSHSTWSNKHCNGTVRFSVYRVFTMQLPKWKVIQLKNTSFYRIVSPTNRIVQELLPLIIVCSITLTNFQKAKTLDICKWYTINRFALYNVECLVTQ